MTDPAGPVPAAPDAVPDSAALRRRVLLTGVLTVGGYLLAAYVLAALEAPPWYLLVVLVLLGVLVVRPLMRPVREANRLRRSLAYQAFLDGRESDRG